MTEDQFDEAAGAPITEEAADGDAVADLTAEAAERTEPEDNQVTTGVQVVDDVLGTLEGLADQPVEEHLPIFEAAHEELRGALDGVDVTGGQNDADGTDDTDGADQAEPESQSD